MEDEEKEKGQAPGSGFGGAGGGGEWAVTWVRSAWPRTRWMRC